MVPALSTLEHSKATLRPTRRAIATRTALPRVKGRKSVWGTYVCPGTVRRGVADTCRRWLQCHYYYFAHHSC